MAVVYHTKNKVLEEGMEEGNQERIKDTLTKLVTECKP